MAFKVGGFPVGDWQVDMLVCRVLAPARIHDSPREAVVNSTLDCKLLSGAAHEMLDVVGFSILEDGPDLTLPLYRVVVRPMH